MADHTTDDDAKVDTATAARLVGLAPATLRRRRTANKPPRSFKVAGRVLYRVGELRQWLAEQEQRTVRGDWAFGAGTSVSPHRRDWGEPPPDEPEPETAPDRPLPAAMADRRQRPPEASASLGSPRRPHKVHIGRRGPDHEGGSHGGA